MGSDEVIDGGTKMKKRRASANDISDEQIETFYVTLTETCNVVRAAKAAGFSSSWAYRKRKRDAAFRSGWARSVREGYAKLELMLLERAMKGTPKTVFRRDGSEHIIREYSTALAVALLRRHADTADEAGYEHDGDELRETRERIMEKLERMRARDEGQAEGVETKGAVDRIGLIRWGLKRQQALTPLACGESPSPGSGEGERAVDRVEIIRWGLQRSVEQALTPLACGESPSTTGRGGR